MDTVVFAFSRSGVRDFQPRVALRAPARPENTHCTAIFVPTANCRALFHALRIHKNSGVSEEEQKPHLFEKPRSASICLSRFPFLAVFSWHSFGLNSCALRNAALCFALHRSGSSRCAPFGFRYPRKDFNLSQRQLEKSCRSLRKSTPCCLGAAADSLSGCPREQGQKRR